MATIRKEIIIDAKPEQVWDAVRDVGAVHRRFVPGYTVDTRLDGDFRILTFANGAVVREHIVAVDDEARRLAYAVVEGSMPLVHHHASFQVFAEKDSRSRLVWITDFLPHELATEIRMRVERGAEVMKQTIEAEVKADS
ncbi:SRPBCC family protein [Paenibacillus tyrfis]|uniref:SRPBCC family protein n=1 Tax=Paenibacillus tyrfis TaxID=1501230 RepID=UPI00209E2355|nr:SRPBCC family protein [Paenibacillus tyrfis]MCP1305724.1 SRPBCC family protein [Paenibacillus tyrfis]